MLSKALLEAYLNEELSVEETTQIEEQIRDDIELKKQLIEILSRRDAGIHSLGEIWRRHRITCPSRPQLQQYLLEVLTDEESEYIRFHLDVIKCRPCTANLTDLVQATEKIAAEGDDGTTRRRKYFQSSVGGLRKAT